MFVRLISAVGFVLLSVFASMAGQECNYAQGELKVMFNRGAYGAMEVIDIHDSSRVSIDGVSDLKSCFEHVVAKQSTQPKTFYGVMEYLNGNNKYVWMLDSNSSFPTSSEQKKMDLRKQAKPGFWISCFVAIVPADVSDPEDLPDGTVKVGYVVKDKNACDRQAKIVLRGNIKPGNANKPNAVWVADDHFWPLSDSYGVVYPSEVD